METRVARVAAAVSLPTRQSNRKRLRKTMGPDFIEDFSNNFSGPEVTPNNAVNPVIGTKTVTCCTSDTSSVSVAVVKPAEEIPLESKIPAVKDVEQTNSSGAASSSSDESRQVDLAKELHLDMAQWSPDQCAAYFSPKYPELGRLILEHSLHGSSLLMLTRAQFIDLFNLRLGTALKFHHAICVWRNVFF